VGRRREERKVQRGGDMERKGKEKGEERRGKEKEERS
jgi:hypothetical protein